MSFVQMLMAATSLATPVVPEPRPDVEPRPSTGGPWRGMGATQQSLRNATGAQLSIAPADVIGGTGGQYGRDVAISADGQRLIYLIDVGGIWRSDDAGTSWVPSNTGFVCVGGMSAIIDPNDKDVIWVLGTSHKTPQGYNGLYVSTTGARQWEIVKGSAALDWDWRDALCLGSNERTPGGRSRRCYWASNRNNGDSAYYRGLVEATIDDAGNVKTDEITELPAARGAGSLATHWGQARAFYLANKDNGLYRIERRGSSWIETRLDGGLEGGNGVWTSVTTCPLAPNTLWASTEKKIYRSDNQGSSWTNITNNLRGLLASNLQLFRLRVSPADADRLGVTTRNGPSSFGVDSFVTHTGGASWQKVQVDHKGGWLKAKREYTDGNLRRCQPFAWHPKDPDICFAMGGPWVTRSTDGARNFEYYADGIEGLSCDVGFNFNPRYPHALYIGHKDHAHRITLDGGLTWTYCPILLHEMSQCGIVVRAEPNDVVIFAAENKKYIGEPLYLVKYTSNDGGSNWSRTDTGESWTSAKKSHAVVLPSDLDRIFIGDLKTINGGKRWSDLPVGANAPLCVSYVSPVPITRRGRTEHLLIGMGKDKESIVESMDGGDTWQVMAEIGGYYDHVDFDCQSQTLFWTIRTSQRNMFRGYRKLDGGANQQLTTLPSNAHAGYPGQFEHAWKSVACDPTRPGRVYFGAGRSGLIAANAIVVSDNATAADVNSITWTEISWTSQEVPKGVNPGAAFAHAMRVNPATGELWVAAAAHGTFVYDPARAS